VSKEFKQEILDIAIICCLFLAVASFPFSKILPNQNESLLASTIAHFVAIILLIIFFIFKKKELRELLFTASYKWLLLLAPTFLLCASNIIWLFAFSLPNREPNGQYLLCYTLYTLSVVISEEIVFRYALLGTLLKYMKHKEIASLISAFAFALAHLLSFNFISSPGPAFIQAGYTFIIGLIMGFAYQKKNGFSFSSSFSLTFQSS